MDIQSFFISPFPLTRLPVAFLNVVCEMAPYLLLNAMGIDFSVAAQDACCMSSSALPSPFKIICATVLTLLIIFALMMKFFSKFTAQKPLDPDVTVYRVEDMHCSHCEAAVVRAVVLPLRVSDIRSRDVVARAIMLACARPLVACYHRDARMA